MERLFRAHSWTQLNASTQLWPQFLNDAQVEKVLRSTQRDRAASLITAPRLTLLDGERAFVTVERQTAYVADLKPKGDDLEPVVEIVNAGIRFECQANVSDDRKLITLALTPRLTELLDLRPEPWSKTPPGKTNTIQVPHVLTHALNTTITVPNQQTAVYRVQGRRGPVDAALDAEDSRPLLMLIRPKVIATQPAELR